jgi:flavodoxin I
MKKSLVAYFSRTGNTQLIAETIHDALPEPKEIQRLTEDLDLEPCGLLFVGFPVETHSVPYKVEAFLRRIPARKKIALFCTHGSLTGSTLAREAVQYAQLCAGQAVVVGTFSCRGKVSIQALEVLKKSPEHAAWADMAVSASTHPDASDREDARAFVKWVLTLGSQGGPF